MHGAEKTAKRKKGGIILKLLLFGFVAYSATSLIKLSVDIKEKKESIVALQGEIEKQYVANEVMRSAIDRGMTKEDVMRISREKLNMTTEGARIFINIDGQ